MPSPLALPPRRGPVDVLLAVALLLTVWVGARAQVPADRLTVREAAQAALQRASSPAAAEALARGARERAVAAAQRPDPQLRLSLDNLPIDGPERYSTTRDFMTMRSIALMQTFTREEKRRARAARYEREADAAQAERGVRVAALQRDTALAWFERLAAERQVALLRAQRDEARLQYEAAEAALRGGRGRSADAILARDAIAQLDQALLAAEAEAANARIALARWTGGAVDAPLAEAPSLQQSSFDIARLDRHPELELLRAREAAAVADAEAARAEREPDWSAELMFSQRGSRYSNMVSIALSVPLQWDRPQRQDRELAARLATVDALRAEREELLRERRSEAERWRAAWQAGLSQLALIRREREPLARQRIEAALAAYRSGSAALASVLEARRAELALQIDTIALELDTARVWSRLEFLLPNDAVPVAAKE